MPLKFLKNRKHQKKAISEKEEPSQHAVQPQSETQNPHPGETSATVKADPDQKNKENVYKSTIRPTFEQNISSKKEKVDGLIEEAERLLQEDNPDSKLISEWISQVKEAWDAMSKHYNENRFKYVFRDIKYTFKCTQERLKTLAQLPHPKTLADATRQQSSLAALETDVKVLQEMIQSLKKEASDLCSKESEEQQKAIKDAFFSASQDLEKLTNKVAEKRARLIHAHSLQSFLKTSKLLTQEIQDAHTTMLEGDVVLMKQKALQVLEDADRRDEIEHLVEHAEHLNAQARTFHPTEKKRTGCCQCF